MRSPLILPAAAFVAAAGCGVSLPLPAPHVTPAVLVAAALVILLAARHCRNPARASVVCATCVITGVLHGAAARDAALHAPLRSVLDHAYGGFAIDTVGVSGAQDATRVRATLIEDAADQAEFVSVRAHVVSVRVDGRWEAADGGVVLSVSGSTAHDRVARWRAGRTIEAPVTFRRPARYLDDGVADFEVEAALGGVTLFGSIKSGLLVDVTARGTRMTEAAADVRAFVRRAVGRWIAPHGAVSAAIVTAVLIGDRAGLPDEVRARLQAAGTYHVIAISGGNIAIFAALIVAVCAALGVHGRMVAVLAILALLAYAQVAASGASVWRATLMAVLYFAARLFDHRTPAWHAVALAAAVMAIVEPLDTRDVGFLLTFGATAALLEAARIAGTRLPRRRLPAWVATSVAASLAAEIALLPVSAAAFSRVTAAGLVLNVAAVPVMGIVQVAGLATVACAYLPVVAAPAGWVAAQGAWMLVASARLVEAAPWLVRRVPPPAFWMIVGYYAALGVALCTSRSRRRVMAVFAMAGVAALIVGGIDLRQAGRVPGEKLRLTMFDVGQGESMLLDVPGGGHVLVDAGGAPFGSGGFDIGGRVVTPALWARGVRALDVLLVTHGDPDHLGGAGAVLADFRPRRVWWGIVAPPHQQTREFLDSVAGDRIPIDARRTGQEFPLGRARVRILNPPEPDWERQRVRNDDSVALEIVYGDVALLLTGDISASVERGIVPYLTHAPIRILKVAHHGSRTSTSPELLDAWRPQIAIVSCGRGNTFGHPAPDVIERLGAIGARVFRTDRDGEITLETDGRRVSASTFTGGER